MITRRDTRVILTARQQVRLHPLQVWIEITIKVILKKKRCIVTFTVGERIVRILMKMKYNNGDEQFI